MSRNPSSTTRASSSENARCSKPSLLACSLTACRLRPASTGWTSNVRARSAINRPVYPFEPYTRACRIAGRSRMAYDQTTTSSLRDGMPFEALTSSSNAAGLIPPKHTHVVQFYENNQFLYDALAAFVGGALTHGKPAVVIARPESVRGLTARLARSGVDVDHARSDGQLIINDAHSMLSRFMRGSIVDEDRFMKEVGGLIEGGLHGRDVVVRAFGEMVDILFRDGNTAAAIRVEELWNGLSHRYPFDLLCGCAIGNFYTDRHAEQLRDICDRHSHVVPAESYSLLQREDQRARAIIELQQRARALEIEIEHRKAVEHALRDALVERQDAIIEAQCGSAAKSDFLAVISDELRTPLTAVLGY